MKNDFTIRYAAVIDACSRFVHARHGRGQKYVTTTQLAEFIAHSLPTLYRKTFGSTPKHLKVWRVKTMISNAAFLGAFGDHDVRSVRGRGFTVTVAARAKKAA